MVDLYGLPEEWVSDTPLLPEPLYGVIRGTQVVEASPRLSTRCSTNSFHRQYVVKAYLLKKKNKKWHYKNEFVRQKTWTTS